MLRRCLPEGIPDLEMPRYLAAYSSIGRIACNVVLAFGQAPRVPHRGFPPQAVKTASPRNFSCGQNCIIVPWLKPDYEEPLTQEFSPRKPCARCFHSRTRDCWEMTEISDTSSLLTTPYWNIPLTLILIVHPQSAVSELSAHLHA